MPKRTIAQETAVGSHIEGKHTIAAVGPDKAMLDARYSDDEMRAWLLETRGWENVELERTPMYVLARPAERT